MILLHILAVGKSDRPYSAQCSNWSSAFFHSLNLLFTKTKVGFTRQEKTFPFASFVIICICFFFHIKPLTFPYCRFFFEGKNLRRTSKASNFGVIQIEVIQLFFLYFFLHLQIQPLERIFFVVFCKT